MGSRSSLSKKLGARISLATLSAQIALGSLSFGLMPTLAGAVTPGCDVILNPGDNIQTAVTAASNGDVICLNPGLYQQTATINITKQVTITRTGCNADAIATRTAGDITTEAIVDAGNSTNAFLINDSNVTLQCLEVRNAAADIIYSDDSGGATANVVVKNNIVHDSSSDEGIQLKKAPNALVQYNDVFDTAGDGINVSAGSNNAAIRDNRVHDIDSGDAAIYVYDATGVTIDGNLVYDVNNNDAIKMGYKDGDDKTRDGGDITNNVIVDTAQDGIAVYMSDLTVSGNKIKDSSTSNGGIYVAYASNDIDITDNYIVENSRGVKIGGAGVPTNVTVNDNCIAGNTVSGLTTNSVATLNAEGNWWGSSTGPTNGSNPGGTGDSVSGNVDFTPFNTTGCTLPAIVDGNGDGIPDGSDDPLVFIPACSGSSTFDSFSNGSVNAQGGWESTGPYDQEVVANTYGFSGFGCKTLRLSNAVTTSSFGDQTFTVSNADEAGETSATNGGKSGGTRQNHFEAEFDIATASSAEQAGLAISVSPDRGDGSRMSYLRFEDDATGVDVFFSDVQGTDNPADFVETQIADDLSRTVPHTVKFVIDYLDGPSNDVVKIYIDGVLVHMGTSWENYYRYDAESSAEQSVRTTDSLLLRSAGASSPSTDGKGFLFDNFDVSSSTTPATGSLTVNKYFCPTGTVLSRAANGPDSGGAHTVPAECVADNGVEFGYVHQADKTDYSSPYLGLNDATPYVSMGDTSAGTLTATGLAATGRYNVAELDGSGNWVADPDVLAFYCAGTDTGESTNNYEIAFVPAGGTTHCVAYNEVNVVPMTLGYETAESGTAPGIGSCPLTTADMTANSGNSSLQHLEWTYLPAADHYDVFGYVWNGSSWNPFPPYALSNLAGSNQEIDVPNGTFTYKAFATNESKYAYQIKAIDADGDMIGQTPAVVDGSFACTFTVDRSVPADTTAPNTPTHLSPADGAIMTSAALTMSDWTDVTDPSVPVTYVYQSSHSTATNSDGSFVTPVYTSPLPLATSDIAHGGTPEGTYYWHVRAVDSAGNASPWSAYWTLIVDNTPPVACTTADADVAFYLPFDETSGTTANDSSLGGSMDGTHVNGPVISTDVPTLGFANARSLDFDGTDDYVDLANSSSFATPPSFSVSAWVKADTIGIDRQIVSKGFNGTQTEWEMKTTTAGGHVSIQTYNGAQFGVQALTPLVEDAWTHVVGTFDGTTWKIYLNGFLNNSNAAAAPIATSNPIHVGAVDNQGTPFQFWDGNIDDVRFYGRALTEDEVDDLVDGACAAVDTPPAAVCGNDIEEEDEQCDDGNMLNGDGCSNSCQEELEACVMTDDYLVAHWEFDAGTGSVAYDATDVNNEGAVTGASWIAGVITAFYNPFALSFDGSDDIVTVSNTADLSFDSDDAFTISAWTKASSFGGYETIVQKMDDSTGAQPGFVLTLANGVPQLWLQSNYAAGEYLQVGSTTVLAPNAWNHVAVTYDGSGDASGVRIYLNDVDTTGSIGHDNLAGSIVNAGEVEIGNRNGGSFQQLSGDVDDVRVYETALNSTQVSALAGGACNAGVVAPEITDDDDDGIPDEEDPCVTFNHDDLDGNGFEDACEGGGGDDGDSGGTGGDSQTQGRSAPQLRGSQGSRRGSQTNILNSLIALFGGDGEPGDVPPGGFGGPGEEEFTDEETEVICRMRKALPEDATSDVREWVANELAGKMPHSEEAIAEELKTGSICPREIVRTKAEAKPVAFHVDASGFPVSTNDTWNKCVRGTATLADIRNNPDRDDDGYGISCSRYHTSTLWRHPDLGVYFTWKSQGKSISLPVGYAVKQDAVAQN